MYCYILVVQLVNFVQGAPVNVAPQALFAPILVKRYAVSKLSRFMRTGPKCMGLYGSLNRVQFSK